MTEYYTYQKKREDFGRFPDFEDTEVSQIGNCRQIKNKDITWELKDPQKHVLDNIPITSEHSVNTE